MIAAQPDAVWVLPLQVVSENDSVNSEKNELFLQITGVITPSFGFGSSAVSVKEYSYGFAVAEKVTFALIRRIAGRLAVSLVWTMRIAPLTIQRTRLYSRLCPRAVTPSRIK